MTVASVLCRALKDVGAHPTLTTAEVVNNLLVSWAQPHRVYHTTEHLTSVLGLLGTWHASAVTVVAAGYHDVIYVPSSSSNELDSANRAAQDLTKLGVDGRTVEVVYQLVLATKTHDINRLGGTARTHGAMLCDADLAILAASPQQYSRYAAGVRAEYHMFDDETWAKGRKAVLESLLGRYRLFYAATEFEAPARANMANELLLLSSA